MELHVTRLRCPECARVFSASEAERRFARARCPACPAILDLTHLVRDPDGIERPGRAPADWAQPVVHAPRMRIDARWWEALSRALVVLETPAVREYLRPVDSDIVHCAMWRDAHASCLGEEYPVDALYPMKMQALSRRLRHEHPERGDLVRAGNVLEEYATRWQVARARQTPDAPWACAARELRAAMSDISEGAASASWLPGQEYTIHSLMRDAAADPPSPWAHAATPGRRLRLRELYDAAGGWWSWPEAYGAWVCEPTAHAIFVPADVWEAHIAALTAADAGVATGA